MLGLGLGLEVAASDSGLASGLGEAALLPFWLLELELPSAPLAAELPLSPVDPLEHAVSKLPVTTIVAIRRMSVGVFCIIIIILGISSVYGRYHAEWIA